MRKIVPIFLKKSTTNATTTIPKPPPFTSGRAAALPKMRTIQALTIEDAPQQRQLPPAQISLSLAPDEAPSQNFELRGYQIDLLDRLQDLWNTGTKRVLLQCATGSGKTVMLSTVIDRALAKGQTCLVLVHREELLSQSIAKIEAITGTTPGAIKAGRKPDKSSPVQVASVATLVNRLDQYPSFDVLILDESHHSNSATWLKIIQHFSNSYLLGVSATPERLDGSGFKEIFDVLISGISMAELIAQRHLSKFKYFAPANGLNLDGLRTRAGDYTRESIEAANSAIEVAADCLKAYQDYLWGKQTLVFAVSVAHSREIASSFSAQGIPAAHLDGRDDPALRASTMEAFRTGAIRVLCNCALFTEGLDVPGIDAVILARPTKSLGLWLQMVGRALRPSPGKDHATIIDLGENWTRFGLPADDREWSLDGIQKKPRAKLERDEDGEVIEVVEVPEDLTIDLQASNLELMEVVAPKPEAALSSDELMEWQERIDRLVATMEGRGYKPGWITYRLAELKPNLKVWKMAGKALNFKPGWAFHKHREFTLGIQPPPKEELN
jgi:superfamily II DNA or RNA helicase